MNYRHFQCDKHLHSIFFDCPLPPPEMFFKYPDNLSGLPEKDFFVWPPYLIIQAAERRPVVRLSIKRVKIDNAAIHRQ